MEKIKINRIKCKFCGDIITSNYRHDFKWCRCGRIAVDGGHDYRRRCSYRKDYEEMSIVEDDGKELPPLPHRYP
ncbi:DUF7695 domain-containing protein [Candidatus Avelusimicrobium fimicolum]|uniref:DUF7695 domain-containing protein n=1 Tax=Candidatus Avelusimicrobium fimicolum TaxID=3416216 RepID=UPI003D0B8427